MPRSAFDHYQVSGKIREMADSSAVERTRGAWNPVPAPRQLRLGAAIELTLTPHHAKYFAHYLTRRAASGMDRLSMALFDAAVDLNPHQIEASLFALQSPLSKGVPNNQPAEAHRAASSQPSSNRSKKRPLFAPSVN